MAAPAIDPEVAAKMAAMAKALQQKDVKKAGTIQRASNLNNLIQTIRVLNRSDEESTISDEAFGANTNPNAANFIKSDSDEELLILVEFRENIDLETVSFHACSPEENKTNGGDDGDGGGDEEDEDEEDEDGGVSAPKKVFLYKVESLNKDFDDAQSAKPDVKVVCDSTKLSSNKGHVLNLKKKGKTAIKFRKCSKIMIFIASNQDGTEQTFISGIKFTGNASAKTDMSKWEDACKR